MAPSSLRVTNDSVEGKKNDKRNRRRRSSWKETNQPETPPGTGRKEGRAPLGRFVVR